MSKSPKKIDLSQERIIENEKLRVFHQIATFIIHDLKNLTTTLSLIVENSVKNIKNGAFLKQSFEAINNEVEKMQKIIDALSAIPMDICLEFQKRNLNDLVINTLAKFKLHNIKIIKKLGEIPLVGCDTAYLETVFHNIIKNSIEAMPEGGNLSISTKVIKKKLENYVEITFSDTGYGIPKNFLKNGVLKAFKTTKDKGLGIGLYQCKQIVERHRGTIKVESEEKKGTKCTVILPVKESFISEYFIQSNP